MMRMKLHLIFEIGVIRRSLRMRMSMTEGVIERERERANVSQSSRDLPATQHDV